MSAEGLIKLNYFSVLSGTIDSVLLVMSTAFAGEYSHCLV